MAPGRRCIRSGGGLPHDLAGHLLLRPPVCYMRRAPRVEAGSREPSASGPPEGHLVRSYTAPQPTQGHPVSDPSAEPVVFIGAMEEKEIKGVLLALVEQHRNSPRDVIPGDVKGWRFPSRADATLKTTDADASDDQYNQPVCFWTGVMCDPIDGSVTGLNLGNGFYAEKLLGMQPSPLKKEQGEGKKTKADVVVDGNRRMLGSAPEMMTFNNKKSYLESKKSSTEAAGRRRRIQTATHGVGPTVPSAIGRLHTLRFLNLSFNQLQGSIPDSIVQLPHLEIFEIQSNDLEGTLPHFESDALRVLDLSVNRFHGTLDEDFFGHPKIGKHTAPYLLSLVKFDLSHNGFTG